MNIFKLIMTFFILIASCLTSNTTLHNSSVNDSHLQHNNSPRITEYPIMTREIFRQKYNYSYDPDKCYESLMKEFQTLIEIYKNCFN